MIGNSNAFLKKLEQALDELEQALCRFAGKLVEAFEILGDKEVRMDESMGES